MNSEFSNKFITYFTNILKINSTSISQIVLNYCFEPYLEPSFGDNASAQFKTRFNKKKINSIIQLKSGLIAFGTSKGDLYTIDSITKNLVHKLKAGIQHPSGDYYTVSLLCEFSDNMIACGSEYHPNLVIQNLNNKKYKILPFDTLKVKGIMCLNSCVRDQLMIGFISGIIIILNVKTNTLIQSFEEYSPIFALLTFNNKLIIGQQINSIIIKNFNKENEDELKITATHYVRTFIHLPNNLLAVVECLGSRGSSSEAGDYIGIYNLDTLQCINKIKNIKGCIFKIVFLIDRFIAITAHCKIMIVDFITCTCIQELEYKNDTVEEHINDIVTLTLLNDNKLIAATSNGVVMFDIVLKN